MKEFKGTPGPWLIDGLDVGAEFNIDSADGGISVGITSQIFRDKDNEIRRANTQLIAAAPDLLELVISAILAQQALTRWRGKKGRKQPLKRHWENHNEQRNRWPGVSGRCGW